MFGGTRMSSGQEEGCPSVAKTSVERGGGQEAERILIEHSLATEKEMLRRAEEACASIRARIEALSTNLASVSVSESSDTTVTASGLRTLLPTYSPEQKLAIFRGLFRGREDVYPVRWEKSKTGPSGYAPECSNKFVRPVCDIEHVRCRACPNRVYRSVTDNAILAHLKGKHVMGIYPLLPDDTCWFLAIDFDENHWQRDIEAVRNACRDFEIPVYVERSRSGNGGHVWFFFSEAVPSVEARTLGSYVLTETMTKYPNLSFASYDRLFPNQDTMPKGGLGNLIALPLQGASRATALEN